MSDSPSGSGQGRGGFGGGLPPPGGGRGLPPPSGRGGFPPPNGGRGGFLPPVGGSGSPAPGSSGGFPPRSGGSGFPPSSSGACNIWGPSAPSRPSNIWGTPALSVGGGWPSSFGGGELPQPSSGTGGIWGAPGPSSSSSGWPQPAGGSIWGSRWAVQPGHIDTQKREAAALLLKVKSFFTQDNRFTYECQLGGVHNGTATRFRYRQDERDPGKRYVVKLGVSGTHAFYVRNEARWLNLFKWGEHIVDTYDLKDNPLVNIGVPFFVMEYLEGGTLKQFQERWSGSALKWHDHLFHHQCSNSRRKAILPIMFGDKRLSRSKHDRVPVLKLIDFGETRERNPNEVPDAKNDYQLSSHDKALKLAQYRKPFAKRNQATDKNIFDVGCVMGRFIANREFLFPADIRPRMRNPDVHPNLDPELRLLLQRCVAEEPLNRPRLPELLDLIQQGIFTKTAADYAADNKLESDKTLDDIVVTYILSATTDQATVFAEQLAGL
ncbi:hypothetical protein F5Y15DRAFT_427549 [Xylariaceae sp. FL0016]|nr:hypothetical protein F5Y15DRAFT_427549 [Xylariaceae sp. FL0016]